MLSVNLDPNPVSSGRSLVAPAAVRIFLWLTQDSNLHWATLQPFGLGGLGTIPHYAVSHFSPP